jgi:hypothetical protein
VTSVSGSGRPKADIAEPTSWYRSVSASFSPLGRSAHHIGPDDFRKSTLTYTVLARLMGIALRSGVGVGASRGLSLTCTVLVRLVGIVMRSGVGIGASRCLSPWLAVSTTGCGARHRSRPMSVSHVSASALRPSRFVYWSLALIEWISLIHFAHDLLKKNAERVQNLAQKSNHALEKYQPIPRTCARAVNVMSKHDQTQQLAFLDLR